MKNNWKIYCLLSAVIMFSLFTAVPAFCGVPTPAETFLTQAKKINLKHITAEIWQGIRDKLHCIETSNKYYAADDNHITNNSTGAFGTSIIAIRQVAKDFGKGWADKYKDPTKIVRADDEIYEYFSMAYADYVWERMESCPKFKQLPLEKQIEDLAVYGWYLPGKYCKGNYTKTQQENINGRIRRMQECQAQGPLPQRDELVQLTEAEGVAVFKFSDFKKYLNIQLSGRFVDFDNDRVLLPVKVGLHMSEKGNAKSVKRALYMDWQVIGPNDPTPFNVVENTKYVFDGEKLLRNAGSGSLIEGMGKLPLGLRIMPFDRQKILKGLIAGAEEKRVFKGFVEIGNLPKIDYTANPFSKWTEYKEYEREFPVNPLRSVIWPVPDAFSIDYWAKRFLKKNPYYKPGDDSAAAENKPAQSAQDDCGCSGKSPVSASPRKVVTAAFSSKTTELPEVSVGISEESIKPKLITFLEDKTSAEDILAGRSQLKEILGLDSEEDVYLLRSCFDGDSEEEVLLSKVDGISGALNFILDYNGGDWEITSFENPALYLQRVIAADLGDGNGTVLIYENEDGAVGSRSISVYKYAAGRAAMLGDFGSYRVGTAAFRSVVDGGQTRKMIMLEYYPEYERVVAEPEGAPVIKKREYYGWDGEKYALVKKEFPNSIGALNEFLYALMNKDYSRAYQLMHDDLRKDSSTGPSANPYAATLEEFKHYIGAAFGELLRPEEDIIIDGGNIRDFSGGANSDTGYLRFRKLDKDENETYLRLIMQWNSVKKSWSVIGLEEYIRGDRFPLSKDGSFAVDALK